LTEQDKRKTKVNLRSQGKFDVAKLALHFGGGGHKKAAGFTANGAVIDIVNKIAGMIQ